MSEPLAEGASPNVPVWEAEGWAGYPALHGDVEADACVVGLGGSGLSCAAELLELGQRVVGVDAGAVAGGAAGRNGGFLLAGASKFYHDAVNVYGRERALAIYRATVTEIGRISAETPDAVRRVGSLRIAANSEEEMDCHVQLQAMRADHLPAMPYSGPEGHGLLVTTDAAFDPLLRCRLLAKRVSDAGALLFEQSPAVELAAGEVRTPNGRVRCAKTIVCVDGHLERLVPALKGRVRTARLQMLATEPVERIRFGRPVYMRWGYEWFQQLADRRLAIGGFRDRAGESEWTHDSTPTERVQGMIEDFLRNTLRITEPVTHRWAASVGYTKDGLPVLEQVAPGTWAAGGYCGTGNVIGAICGRAAAQLAVRGASELARPFAAA